MVLTLPLPNACESTEICMKCSFLPAPTTGATGVPGNLQGPPGTSEQILVTSGQPPGTSRDLRATSGEVLIMVHNAIYLPLCCDHVSLCQFVSNWPLQVACSIKHNRLCSRQMESMILAQARCRSHMWVTQPKRSTNKQCTSTNNVTPTKTKAVIWLEQSAGYVSCTICDECAPHWLTALHCMLRHEQKLQLQDIARLWPSQNKNKPPSSNMMRDGLSV